MTDVRSLALSVLMPGFNGTTAPPWLLSLAKEGLGSVCLFGQNCETIPQVRALGDELREANPGLLVCADEEAGSVSRLDGGWGSPWPAAAALGALDDVEATRAIGEAVGTRANSAGIDLVIAPVLDVNSEADNPVIGTRSFGADPDLVSRHGVAFARGLRDAGVIGCGKHFPGHGATVTDTHVGLAVVDADEATWRARDLPPFAAAIADGLPTVMTAHVIVSALDDQPSTVSPRVLRVLRDELGFTGVIASDALDMKAIADGIGKPAGAVRALAAGVDLVCIGNPAHPADYEAEPAVEEIVEAIVAAVEDGSLSVNRLTEAAGRVAALARPTERPEPRPREELVREAVGIAARAVDVTGDPRTGSDALVVVPRPVVGYAAGRTDSALLSELKKRRPDWWIVEVADLDATVAALQAREGREVVVVLEGSDTRSRFPLVNAVLAEAPDAVVVHSGLRSDDDPGARTIHTHGIGGAVAVATADLLTGESR